MDWKAFISSIIGSLAWPAVATLFIFMVRRQLIPLLERLEEIALPGGTKAKFYKDLKEIREKVEELPGDKASAVPPPSPSEEDEFLKLAETYPSAAILEAYKPVEKSLNTYKVKFPDRNYRTPNNFIRELFESQGFGDEILWLFKHVRSLRNNAAHAREIDLTVAGALDYRDACLRVAKSIEAAIQMVEEKTLIARAGYAGNGG